MSSSKLEMVGGGDDLGRRRTGARASGLESGTVKPLLYLLPGLLVLLAQPASAAERLLVSVQEGVASQETERVLGTAVELARELSALTVQPVSGVARRCGDEACLRTRVSEAGAEHGLFLRITAMRRGMLEVELLWMDGAEGRSSMRQVPGVAVAGLKEALRPAVAALVPPFARKGWGGLVVASESARLRVDGRVLTPASEVVPLTAGPHEVDLLLPSGEALLSRALVPEGARLRLAPAQESSSVATRVASRGKGLRTASYVTFSLGALAVAGSLVAGGLSRGALEGMEPCAGADRGCARYPAARDAYEKSDRYARTGNVLLGVGGALSTVGIGLFVFDLASSEE